MNNQTNSNAVLDRLKKAIESAERLYSQNMQSAYYKTISLLEPDRTERRRLQRAADALSGPRPMPDNVFEDLFRNAVPLIRLRDAAKTVLPIYESYLIDSYKQNLPYDENNPEKRQMISRFFLALTSPCRIITTKVYYLDEDFAADFYKSVAEAMADCTNMLDHWCQTDTQRMIRINSCVIAQAENNHVTIRKNGRTVFHIQCSKPCSEAELHELYDFYKSMAQDT